MKKSESNMYARLLLLIASLSSGRKSAFWRWWYQRLASNYQKSDWRFMNYGYQPLHSSSPLSLEPEDERWRYAIQLYDFVLKDIDLKGKKVLEIGSGRGGGAEYVARCNKSADLIAVDYSPKAIALSRRFYDHPNLFFTEGNAEDLPFSSGSFDVIYNIESSHCFGNMAAFVSEVERVLKPGGDFCWADLRSPKQLEKDEKLFENSSLTFRHKEEITPNVFKALELASDTKEQAIRSYVPALILGIFREIAAIRNTKIFRAIEKGKLQYWHYRLQKPY